VSYDDTIKIMVLGDESVEKTSLIIRFISGFFLEDLKLTIGVDFYSKTINIDEKKIKLQIWDFAGEERFRFLLHQYCKNARGGLFVFNISDSSSLAHIDDWLSAIRKGVGPKVSFPILVVGLLPDDDNLRKISTEEGKKIANSRNLSGYIECNLKTGENVGKVLDELIRLILANEEYQTPIKIKKYEEFIVYDLKNTGDPTKLNINPEELQYHLNPKKVLIIILNDLRRIFIWKGAKSPVRKRFISARVAQDLHRELIKDARYQRCKIVSIKQGNEKQEFLNAFRLESMEVTERLPDMRYIGNIERDTVGLSEEEKEKIKEKILKISVPESLKRQNLILGHKLYGELDRFLELERLTKEQKFLIANILIISNIQINPSKKKTYLRLFLDRFPDLSDQDKKDIIQSIEDEWDGKIDDDDYIPFPYIFNPPEPPDDLALAPRVQLHASPKKKVPEEKIHCQFCGMKLTKEEQFTHSCKKKPKNK